MINLSTIGFLALPQPEWLVYIAIGMLVLNFLTGIIFAAKLSDALSCLPPTYRSMSPSIVWLLLIPVFQLVWNFVVCLRIASAYKNYFTDQARHNLPPKPDHTQPCLQYQSVHQILDTGHTRAWLYGFASIIALLTLNILIYLVAWVLQISFLAKISSLKHQLPPIRDP